jgi:hypothetical protein
MLHTCLRVTAAIPHPSPPFHGSTSVSYACSQHACLTAASETGRGAPPGMPPGMPQGMMMHPQMMMQQQMQQQQMMAMQRQVGHTGTPTVDAASLCTRPVEVASLCS